MLTFNAVFFCGQSLDQL